MKKLSDYALAGMPNIRKDLGLETEMQKNLRLQQEGLLMGRQFGGLPAPIASLAQGIAANVPSIRDNVRQLGVEKGLNLQTESELFDLAIGEYDGTPESQARVVQSLTRINPQYGAAMANTLQRQRLEVQKINQDLNKPKKYEPYVAINDEGEAATYFVSDDMTIADAQGNILEGDDIPKTIFKPTTQTTIGELGPRGSLQNTFMEREAIAKGFIRNAQEAYRMIENAPASNTVAATVSNAYNALKENLNFISTNSLFEEQFKKGKKNQDRVLIDKKLDDLGIQGSRFRALMINLAYQKAKAMQGTSDRISDTDLTNALQAIGGNVSDADAIKAILIDNMNEVATKYQSDYETAFSKEEDYAPYDAFKEFKVSEFFDSISYSPDGTGSNEYGILK